MALLGSPNLWKCLELFGVCFFPHTNEDEEENDQIYDTKAYQWVK